MAVVPWTPRRHGSSRFRSRFQPGIPRCDSLGFYTPYAVNSLCTTLASTRFNDAVAEAGKEALDVVDLIDAVTDRLDMVGFTPATDYQRRMTSMRFCLTVMFGATEIGFAAANIHLVLQAAGWALRWREPWERRQYPA